MILVGRRRVSVAATFITLIPSSRPAKCVPLMLVTTDNAAAAVAATTAAAAPPTAIAAAAAACNGSLTPEIKVVYGADNDGDSDDDLIMKVMTIMIIKEKIK